jgi:hypothetical protein
VKLEVQRCGGLEKKEEKEEEEMGCRWGYVIKEKSN